MSPQNTSATGSTLPQGPSSASVPPASTSTTSNHDSEMPATLPDGPDSSRSAKERDGVEASPSNHCSKFDADTNETIESPEYVGTEFPPSSITIDLAESTKDGCHTSPSSNIPSSVEQDVSDGSQVDAMSGLINDGPKDSSSSLEINDVSEKVSDACHSKPLDLDSDKLSCDVRLRGEPNLPGPSEQNSVDNSSHDYISTSTNDDLSRPKMSSNSVEGFTEQREIDGASCVPNEDSHSKCLEAESGDVAQTVNSSVFFTKDEPIFDHLHDNEIDNEFPQESDHRFIPIDIPSQSSNSIDELIKEEDRIDLPVGSRIDAPRIAETYDIEYENNLIKKADTKFQSSQNDPRLPSSSIIVENRNTAHKSKRSSHNTDEDPLSGDHLSGDEVEERAGFYSSRSQLREADQRLPRVASSGSSGGEGVAEELINKFKKQNRRRRSFSVSRGCWSSRRSVLASALRRLFRWGCRRDDSRSRASSRDLSKDPTVSTLSNNVNNGTVNIVPSCLVRNNSEDSTSSKVAFPLRGFAKNVTSRKLCLQDPKVASSHNSPSLSVKSMKTVMNKVQVASSISAVKGSSKVSPVQDLLAMNHSESDHSYPDNEHLVSSSAGIAETNPSESKAPFKDGSLEPSSSESSLSQSVTSSGSDNEVASSRTGHGSNETNVSTNSPDSYDGANKSNQNSSSDVPSNKEKGDKLLNFGRRKWGSGRRKETSEGTSSDNSSPDEGAAGGGDKPVGGIVVQYEGLSATPESRAQHMKVVRSRRLMKEFQELSKGCQAASSPVFSVALVNDCLYEWKVKLHRVDQDSLLHRDMVAYGVPFILLSLSFPDTFPFQPPFLRVLSPRIEKGFVMEGGAICMELLTPRGWASAYTVEAVIMQLSASLVKGQGRISRKPLKEFSKRAAEASFRSLVKTHDKYGWVTPPLADG